MIQLRYPNITGRTTDERQGQMERYFRSLIDQLNWAFQKSEEKKTSDTVELKNAPATGSQIDVEKIIKSYLKTIYPVGYVYISTADTDPGTLFGGTWERIQDRFLLASGKTYAAGSTGGEASHVLVINEIPTHDHRLPGHVWNWGGQGGCTVYAEGAIAAAGTSTPGNNLSTKQNEWVATNTSGGSEAHNNMPPYLAVYVWQRTA